MRSQVLMLLWALTLCGAASADVERTIRVEGSAFAFDPEAGAVAVADTESGALTLYTRAALGGREGGLVGPVSVGDQPVDVVFKKLGERSLFAVLCQGNGRLVLLDSRSLEIVARIPVTGAGPSSLFASLNPADPYVYYCYGNGHDSSLGRVHLEDESVEAFGRLDGRESVADGALSARGDWLYHRGPWSPSGFNAWRIVSAPGAAFEALRITDEHESTPGYVPDATGEYCASGSDLYSVDLATKVATLSARPAGFSANRPLILAFDESDLVILSLNSFQELARTSVPLDRDAHRYGAPPPAFLDDTGERVIVCQPQALHIIALDNLDLPEEPFLSVEVQGSSQFEVGVQGVLGLAPRETGLVVSLDQAPDGVRLDGTRLVWTPTEDDVGPVEVGLRLSAGGTERTLTLDIDVQYPFLALDFVPTWLLTDPEGNRALLLDGDRSGFPWEGAGTTQLALVDIATKTLIARRQLTGTVRTAHLDGHAVYYAPTQGGNLFRTLSLEDLSDGQRVFVNEPVTDFGSLPDGSLLVVNGGEAALYDSQTLKRTGVLGQAAGALGRNPVQLPVRLQDGWLVGSSVVPEGGGAPLMLVWPPPGFPLQSPARGEETAPRLWARVIDARSLRAGDRRAGHVIASWDAQAAALLSTHPAAVTVQRTTTGGGFEALVQSLSLSFHDLVEGQPRRILALQRGPVAPYTSSSMRGPPFAVTATRVLLSDQERLYIVPLPSESLAALPAPVALKRKLAPVVLAKDALTKYTLEADGGTGPYTFSFLHEQPGLELDAASGELSVDGSVLWKSYLRSLQENLGRRIRLEAWEQTVAQAEAAYAALLGEKPGGLPVAVPVLVSVSDTEGQSDKLAATLLLVGPRGEADALVEAAHAAREAELRPVREEPDRSQEAPPPNASGADADALAGLQTRVVQLETRVGDQKEQLAALDDSVEALRRELAEKTTSGDANGPLSIAALALGVAALVLALVALTRRARGA